MQILTISQLTIGTSFISLTVLTLLLQGLQVTLPCISESDYIKSRKKPNQANPSNKIPLTAPITALNATWK